MTGLEAILWIAGRVGAVLLPSRAQVLPDGTTIESHWFSLQVWDASSPG